MPERKAAPLINLETQAGHWQEEAQTYAHFAVVTHLLAVSLKTHTVSIKDQKFLSWLALSSIKPYGGS